MKTIAFLGLGTMGLPMAANLLRAAMSCAPGTVRPPARETGGAGRAAASRGRRGRRCAGVHAGRRRGHALCGAGGRRAGRWPRRCTSTWPPCRWRWRPSWRGCMASAAWPMWRRRCWAGSTWPRPASSISWRPARRGAAGGAAAVRRDGPQDLVFRRRPEQANAVKLAVNFMIGSAIGAMSEAVALVRGYDVDKAAFWRWPRPPHSPRRCTRVMGGHRRRALRAGRLQAGAGPGTCAWRRRAEQVHAAATGRRAARCAHREPGARRGQLDWAACRARRRGGRAGVRRRGEPLLIRRAPRALPPPSRQTTSDLPVPCGAAPAGVAYWLSGRHTAMLSRRRDRR